MEDRLEERESNDGAYSVSTTYKMLIQELMRSQQWRNLNLFGVFLFHQRQLRFVEIV